VPKFRKLRIAWSVAWGVACVFCIAVIVRLQNPLPSPPSPSPTGTELDYRVDRRQTLITVTYPYEPNVDRRGIRRFDYFGFGRQYTWHQMLVTVPHWFPVVVSMFIGYWTPSLFSLTRAAVARLTWRFSLRTLLVATTAVAVGLGLIVWLSS
jgi:hypothetical protein